MNLIHRWRRWFAGPAAAPPRPRIALALQGGGSHGAFTWGVLDRLLEDSRYEIGAISGTSAGALNGAVLVTGLAAGGPAGARAALAGFWRDIAAAGVTVAPTTRWVGRWVGALGPYALNPLGLNPLRDLVRRHVDERALRAGAPALHVTATAVRSGRPRVFSGAELGVDALLASACLPLLFHAVEIDGEPYWDGGYSGNPSLQPLAVEGTTVDVVLVRINPLWRADAPTAGAAITDRVNEIVFNAVLIAELQALADAERLRRDCGRAPAWRLHAIDDDDALARYGAASKLAAEPALIDELFALGRGAAGRFVAQHADDVGRRATFELGDATTGAPR
jgi:NTE family protein